MAGGRSEGGKVGDWKGRLRPRLRSRSGASGREGASTRGKTIKSGSPGKKAALTRVKTIRRKKGGKKRGGNMSVVAVRNVNQSMFGGSTLKADIESREIQDQNGQHQLLPGLLDDITLGLITTKLSWTDLLVLPSISHLWQHAVHTRKVHDARVQARATESLHLSLNYGGGARGGVRVGVYSSGDKPCYRLLPPFTKKEGWSLSVQPSAHSVYTHDGRIYIWVAEGNLAERSYVFRRGLQLIRDRAPKHKTLSLDLAGRKQWTQLDLPGHTGRPRGCRSFPYDGCTCKYLCLTQLAI